MSDHLPECQPKTAPEPPFICICPELRACEERVREDERSSNFTPDDHADGMTEAYQRGLDAVREAVASMEIAVVGNSAATVDQALAVIESLRKGSND